LSLPARTSLAEATQRIDTLVICAPEFRTAIQPWLDFRGQQGHQIVLITEFGTAADIQRTIVALARQSDLQFVVLFGDAAPTTSPTTSMARWAVPTHDIEADVIRRWGASPRFPTDSLFADVDGDGLPDIAVGRVSADSAEEMTGIVAKILAYERSADVGLWRRRVNFVAGVGGFGAIADVILETSAKKLITDGIPASYRTTMTQASWRSPYSPDPRLFRTQTIERMNEGCLAWIYLGHGLAHSLDHYRVPGGGLPIFELVDIDRVSSRAGSPIAVLLACLTGDFAAEEDCLAEELLAAPGGPVAVFAGSSITMPYAMTVMGNAMLDELFVRRRETIGDVVLHAKRTLAGDPAEKGFVEQIARAISPDPDRLNDERREHVKLFNLIGDPLLRIRHPKGATVSAPEYATAGETIEISGTSDINGPCIIELACRRDRMTFKPKRRSTFEATDHALAAMQEVYVHANNATWSSTSLDIENGNFAVTMTVPEDAMGPGHVRVYVQGQSDFAMGSADVYLRPPMIASSDAAAEK
jgi:hypothetical protein